MTKRKKAVFAKAADELLKAGVLTKAEAARLRAGRFMAGVDEHITHRPTKARRTA